MASISDVAKKAGVAKSTVSFVLSNKGIVSEETRKKVEYACKELDYIPNYYASNIMKNNSNIIGLFLNSGKEGFLPFYSELIRAVVEKCRNYNLQVMIYYLPTDDEITQGLVVGGGPLKGAILLSPLIGDTRLKVLKKKNIPFVVIGSSTEGDLFYHVDVNNELIVKNALYLLYKKGHRKIFFFNSPESLTISEFRKKGVLEFCNLYNDCTCEIINGKDDYDETLRLLESNQVTLNYDCFIAQSSNVGNAICDYFKKKGKILGKDFSLILLGGESSSSHPNICRFHQDYSVIGKICVEFLNKIISGDKVEKYIEVDSEYIDGSSVFVKSIKK